jgi:hypothetical protein
MRISGCQPFAVMCRHNRGLHKPRSVRTSTVMDGGTAGASRVSSRSNSGIHAPLPWCGSTTQATGMALPRYSTLMASTTCRSRRDVASTASGSVSPSHQASTQPSSGAKQVSTARLVAQGAARSAPSQSHSRKRARVAAADSPSASRALNTAVSQPCLAASTPVTHSANPCCWAGRNCGR